MSDEGRVIRTMGFLLALALWPCLAMAQVETPRVIQLILYDAARDTPLGPLARFAVLDLEELATGELSVVARTEPAQVGSVSFLLDGAPFSVENVAPYALAGDSEDGTDLHSWRPQPGTYELRAVAHGEADAAGPGGHARTVRFTVTQGNAGRDGRTEGNDVAAGASSPSGSDRAADPHRARFALHPLAERGRPGRILLSDYGHTAVLAVSLPGVEPTATYPVRMYAGSCEDGGEAVLELEPLDGRRIVSTTAMGPATADALAERHHVRVHAADEEATVLACGDLQAVRAAPHP